MADDQAAGELERFLTERADQLMRTAVLLTGSRETGQDLLQTALERLLRHWRTLDGDPEAYLRRTLYNLAADGFRRQGRLQGKLLLLRAAAPPPADPMAEVDLRDVTGTVESIPLIASSIMSKKIAEGTGGQPSVTWAYGRRSRFEEFTGTSCGHVTSPGGDCTHTGGSEHYLAQGTALIKGKLTAAYVTYFDHRYSLSRQVYTPPSSACGKAAMEMGGPAPANGDWPAFVRATLACGGARVTGHVRINGVQTTKLTGKPVTVRLSRGYGTVVHEKYARARWTLYVNPRTYLPVRMIGVSETFGGSGGHTRFASVTNVRWLPPTAANQAKALFTIPPGYQRVSLAAQG